jgi:hypothetical protein
VETGFPIKKHDKAKLEPFRNSIKNGTALEIAGDLLSSGSDACPAAPFRRTRASTGIRNRKPSRLAIAPALKPGCQGTRLRLNRSPSP